MVRIILILYLFSFFSISHSQDIEIQIKNILKNTKCEEGLCNSEIRSFKYVDLNDDGINEIIATDEGSGNGWGRFFVFLTNPVKLVLIMDGDVTYEILNSYTNGFKDIKGMNRGGSYIYKWQGRRYSGWENDEGKKDPFEEFKEKFFSDVKFQKDHISFPLPHEWYEAEFGKTYKEKLVAKKWDFKYHSKLKWTQSNIENFQIWPTGKESGLLLVKVTYFSDYPYEQKYYFKERNRGWYLVKLWENVN
jgi:hypothetical protein